MAERDAAQARGEDLCRDVARILHADRGVGLFIPLSAFGDFAQRAARNVILGFELSEAGTKGFELDAAECRDIIRRSRARATRAR